MDSSVGDAHAHFVSSYLAHVRELERFDVYVAVTASPLLFSFEGNLVVLRLITTSASTMCCKEQHLIRQVVPHATRHKFVVAFVSKVVTLLLSQEPPPFFPNKKYSYKTV